MYQVVLRPSGLLYDESSADAEDHILRSVVGAASRRPPRPNYPECLRPIEKLADLTFSHLNRAIIRSLHGGYATFPPAGTTLTIPELARECHLIYNDGKVGTEWQFSQNLFERSKAVSF